jgi:hypothetical protein
MTIVPVVDLGTASGLTKRRAGDGRGTVTERTGGLG